MKPSMRDVEDLPLDVNELQRLRIAIEASGEIIFMTDAEGTFTYVNPEFVRVYGYAPSEVVGRTTPRLLKSGTTDPETYTAFWSCLSQKQTVRREFVNRTKHGDLLHVESSANPIVDDRGQVVGFLAVQRDITERRRIEAALEESERRYRTLAEAAQDAIFIVNREGLIEYANTVSAAHFRLAADDVIGRRLTDVFLPHVAEELWRALQIVFATGDRQLFEQRFDSPTGELWLETWLVPMRPKGGDQHAVMGVARDVTGRKALERQFVQAQKMEAIGRLAGGVAHDFNNILTAILGFAEFVRDRIPDAPDVVADLDEIRKAGERASELTRQLLAFSRKQPMTPHVLAPDVLVANTKRMLERVVGEDVELSVVSAGGTWPILADRSQMEQILLNLVVNARDAMPKGGSLTITTANRELDETFVSGHPGATPGRYVALIVRDTGCGMTADVLPHVFEPFFTTKPRGQGTGLGLSTVYGIVKQNGGYITIDSDPRTGTVVTVFWPVNDRQTVAAGTPIDAPERARGGTETILLVEDEVGIRRLMRRTLEGRGYRVLEARDVSHALALSETHPGAIDLLLSDVVMPVMNGPDLAQRIVGQHPTIKVLYVSGFPNSLLFEHISRAQRVWLLAKPFTPQALAMNVRECLDAQPVQPPQATVRHADAQASRQEDGTRS